MACEYTYKGTKYTEKEFKTILAEKILGQEASIDNIVSLFTPPTPTISSTRKEAEKEMKGKSDVEVIQVQLDDLLDLLSPPSPQITKTYPFTNIKGSLGKIAKALSKVAPNLTINIVGDKEYVRRAVEAGMTENEAKRSSAFYDALTDSIVINRLMGVHNTLTHEAAHPVVAAALNSNPDLATAFAQKLRSIQTPQGITYGEWVDRNYLSPYTEAEKAIEVVCEFLSNVAIGKHKDLVGQTIWDDLVDFINSILSSLGIELTAPLSTEDDVMAFAKGFGRALKTGAVIRMEKANNELYDKPQPQNRETAIVKAVNDKMVSLIEAGYSVESIKEAFADAKYEPIRKAIENHYGFDFDVYVDGFYEDFNTSVPKEIISTGSFSSSVTPETRKQKVKSFVRSIKSGDISDSDKKRLDTEVGMFYDELPHAELERIGNSIIEELGGLANAVNEAMKVNTTLPPYIRVFVLGQAIIAKRRAEKAAKGEAKNKLADEQNELSVVIEQTLVELTSYIDVMVRDMGRASSYISQFYKTSGLAIIRRAQKEMNERNEAMGKTVSTEDVKDFKSAFEDKAESNESALEAVFDGNAMAKTIEQQQAEIDRLQKELDKKLKTKTGTTISVSRPAKKKVDFGITKEDVEKARKEVLKYLSANPFANPDMYKAVVTVAGYGIQQGIRSFQDFYAYMNKQLNGKHKETYEDIYKALRSKGAENKVTDFDNDSDIAKAIEEIEALEAEIAAKKEAFEKNKKVSQFGRLLSQPVSQATNRKSKEQNLRERAAELDALYNTDSFSKQAEAYIDGKRQDKLTTPQKVTDSIKTALIELGYSKEVNGKKVVDWSGVVKGVKDPKKVWDKIDNVLQDVLSPSDYAIQSPMLRDAFFAEVNDRRAKSVIAEMKKFERKRNPLNRVRRKSRAEHLMELYNTGALDNDTIRQELLDVLGAKQIKDEDWKGLEALMDAIDIAPMGAEKEKLEEELYFRLDELKAGHLLRVYFERMRGRMLAGMITFVKNGMGVTTTTTMLWYKRFINQLSAIKGDRDTHVAQVINNARKMAWINTMDVAWNGGIDMGSAFSETTGTKEGTPRVRYIEYNAIKPILVNLGFTQLEITKASNAIRAFERIPSRGLSAMDTLNAAKLQEMEMYTFIKTKLRAYDPALSNKEAGRKAYEIMYSIPVEQAIAEAYAEFAKRGIEITDSKSDQFRLRRRAYEMIQQKREADAVKAGQYYANRYTFKAHDAGAASVLFLALMGAKQILPLTTNKFVVAHLNKLGKKKAAQNTKEFVEATNEFLFITILPFIKGVTLILEKRLELNTPYGIAKGIAYTVPAILEKDPLKKKVAYQRAGEYYWRAAIGTLASIMIYALADDDEEGGKLIGAGGTKDWKDNAVESTLKTQNSVTMFGHKIPAQAFGTLDLNIMAMGMYQDYLREQKRLYGKDFNENEEEFSLSARIVSTILEDEYLRSAQSLYRGLTDDNGVRQSGYWNRTFAEWFTRSLIPATGFIRQGADALTSEAKKPVGIMENIWKQSGLFSFLVSRKAFDYRGRTYDSGDVYGNGTRAFTTILSKEAAADPIDKFVYKYNPNVSTPSVLNQEYQVRAMDGTERPMTEEEYYDFSYSKSTKFGKLIEAYYKTNPQDQVVNFNMPAVDSDKYYALERDAIAELKQEGKTVNLATDAGFAEMTNKMYEIGEREAVREKISKDISKMNTLASKAAFAEIIAATDSYYVLDYSTALEEYEELLEALSMNKKTNEKSTIRFEF